MCARATSQFLPAAVGGAVNEAVQTLFAGTATAEESAQAAWARGWEKRNHLKEAQRLVQWVNTIALNIFRGRYRKESREEALPVREFSVEPENRLARVDLDRWLPGRQQTLEALVADAVGWLRRLR